MRIPPKSLVTQAAEGRIDPRTTRQFDRYRGWFELSMEDGSVYDPEIHDLPFQVRLTKRAQDAHPEHRRKRA